MSRHQRLELLLFIACFFTFAYFNQGGGWNQNARFAEVRAMVEEGRFAIDDFLVYKRDAETDELHRAPMSRAEFEDQGKRFRQCWVDMEWNLFPVGDRPLEKGVEKVPMIEACASGDIGYVESTGQFHPNKPPGTSFLALPGYFVIYHVEKLLGINPDHWWTLEVNAWLTTVCSVGLISALGCVLFFRLARELADGAALPALLATLTFAFGTTYLPFGTILFDHNLTAALLVAAFYFIRRGQLDSKPRLLVLAGICAGLAAITNYLAAVAVVFLGIYALLANPSGTNRWRSAWLYTLGVIPPFLLICWYGWVCFGSPFTLNTDFQNPLFKDTNAFLGMFNAPSGYVTSLLLVSPFRGMFFFAPVLVAGLLGIVVWLVEKKHVAEARLCIVMFAFFFAMNAMFNGYHGGFSAGPRYLIPGIPFLALPMVVLFARFRAATCAVAAVSIFINLLLTATDAQNPVGVGGHARVEGLHTDWIYNPVGEYAWPLFASGRAWPLLKEQIDVQMVKEQDRINEETDVPGERKARADKERKELYASIDRGEVSPFLLGSLEGPVSVNPIGVYEGLFTYGFFPPGSPQCRWASFNIGEFFWPQSRWSILPLLLVVGGLCTWMIRLAARSSAEDLQTGARDRSDG
jgi:hypothetical protein